MKQIATLDRETILEATFAFVRERGFPQLSARSLAEYLGCSTMPIYSRMTSLSDLKDELRTRTRDILRRFQEGTYTEYPLLNRAIGYVLFARDEPMLFRLLFVETTEPAAQLNSLRDRFLADLGGDQMPDTVLQQLTPSQQERIILHSWVYTHGLAMLVNGQALRVDESEIAAMLRLSGASFFSTIQNSGETE